MDFLNILVDVALWFYLAYAGATVLIYTWIGSYAYGALKQYKSRNFFTDYQVIATDSYVPSFAVIAPAYNEGMTVIENVRSLLSMYYQNLEIVVVNDGSKDNSLELLIEKYELELTPHYIQGNLPCKTIKGVYRSKNKAYKKLLVVDKYNGGKADALNAGINVCSSDYVVAIDVDCILEQDAILKLAKPFLEQKEKKVIAVGASIRLANNCKVVNGKIIEVGLPKSMWGKMQALEYIRAFILGRMAWSRASGLILISGAFGAFEKETLLACGGFDPKTIGEDMELVVRMRRYMEKRKIPYVIMNIPDPLCWTEVPENKSILQKQRKRWMRGTMETLWKHRVLFFNPRYGKLGMVSIPYWFFFEFLGPIIEFSGFILLIFFTLFGLVNWSVFFALLTLVFCAGIFYSVYAIFVDLMTYKVYSKPKDLGKLIFSAIIEPIVFHPVVMWSGVMGAWEYVLGKKPVWGEMTRQGFQNSSVQTKNNTHN